MGWDEGWNVEEPEYFEERTKLEIDTVEETGERIIDPYGDDLGPRLMILTRCGKLFMQAPTLMECTDDTGVLRINFLPYDKAHRRWAYGCKDKQID